MVPVVDIAALHVGALLLPSVKSQRLIGSPHNVTWNKVLGIFRSKYPNKTFFEDVKDPNPSYPIYDNSAAIKVLKELGQDGFISLEEAIAQNVAPYA
jgi:hypothetical protein